jgi:hypothetical protein
VDVPSPIECGDPFGTNDKFGDAARTERLKTGADQFDRATTSSARRVFRPTVAGHSSRHKKPAINIDCLARDITGIIGRHEWDLCDL